MNSSKNKVVMLITLISIYFFTDILPQRRTSVLENSRSERTKEVRRKNDNKIKPHPAKSERIKEKRVNTTKVNIKSRNDKNKDRNPRLPNNNSNTRRKSEVRKEVKVSTTWRSGDVKRRRINHSPKVHITRPRYSKPFIDYYNPYHFRCFTYHNEIVNYYPSFPLRFVSAEIEYLYNERNNYKPYFEHDSYQVPLFVHFFEVNVEVEVKSQYWDKFGVLVQYSDGDEQIILFNEDDEYLFPGNIYKFSKVVALEDFGSINLRLGYYDSDTDSFYPAIYSRNKTDLSIFVSRTSSYTHR